MDRQIEGTASGFTPAPDILIEQFGHTTALIWGKVWRYCQMEDGVCSAAIQRLAKELQLTEKTIAKHISTLEENGYILDTTPDTRNAPHVYIDTGKLRMKFSIFMEENTQKDRYVKNTYRYVKNSHEELLIGENIFLLYESNIGPITPMIADSLKEAEKDYKFSWIEEAIKLSVKHNKRNWAYCETILKRWKNEGKDEGGKPTPAPLKIVRSEDDKETYVPNPEAKQ